MAFPSSIQPAFPRSKRKLVSLSEMSCDSFYDLVGEVVKTFWATPDTIDLYITDYTTNPQLFLYQDPDDETVDEFDFSSRNSQWPGPYGQMTMAIRLYEPHASAARQFQEGDVLFLQNIRVKLSNANKLEGAIHQDHKYTGRVQVHKCTQSSQLDDFRERKEAYEREYQARKAARTGEKPASEPKKNDNEPKKASAKCSAKKKEGKKQKQREEKEKEKLALEKKVREDEFASAGLNTNVTAGYPEYARSTVDEIVNNPYLTVKSADGLVLNLPFINAKYRTRLRVVDHYPFELESFTRNLCDPTFTSKKEHSENQSARYKSLESQGALSDKFVWHFFLLVEDADAPKGTTPTRFPLTMDTPRAQNLLQMDPTDLTNRPDVLAELETKLFTLWGDLHERKVELKRQGIDLPLPVGDERLNLSNKPFECCVEEYGVPVDEKGVPLDAVPEDILGDPKIWKRTWSPFNTTIQM